MFRFLPWRKRRRQSIEECRDPTPTPLGRSTNYQYRGYQHKIGNSALANNNSTVPPSGPSLVTSRENACENSVLEPNQKITRKNTGLVDLSSLYGKSRSSISLSSDTTADSAYRGVCCSNPYYESEEDINSDRSFFQNRFADLGSVLSFQDDMEQEYVVNAIKKMPLQPPPLPVRPLRHRKATVPPPLPPRPTARRPNLQFILQNRNQGSMLNMKNPAYNFPSMISVAEEGEHQDSLSGIFAFPEEASIQRDLDSSIRGQSRPGLVDMAQQSEFESFSYSSDFEDDLEIDDSFLHMSIWVSASNLNARDRVANGSVPRPNSTGSERPDSNAQGRKPYFR